MTRAVAMIGAAVMAALVVGASVALKQMAGDRLGDALDSYVYGAKA
jgi:hypothetical protein